MRRIKVGLFAVVAMLALLGGGTTVKATDSSRDNGFFLADTDMSGEGYSYTESNRTLTITGDQTATAIKDSDDTGKGFTINVVSGATLTVNNSNTSKASGIKSEKRSHHHRKYRRHGNSESDYGRCGNKSRHLCR